MKAEIEKVKKALLSAEEEGDYVALIRYFGRFLLLKSISSDNEKALYKWSELFAKNLAPIVGMIVAIEEGTDISESTPTAQRRLMKDAQLHAKRVEAKKSGADPESGLRRWQ